MKTKLRGFTLIELMVTVAIIGILASFAIPSYLEHITSAKRAEAQGALVSFANAMEQWSLQNGSYCNASDVPPSCTTPVGVFSTQVPITGGGTPTYTLTIEVATAIPPAYTLRATPIDPADGWLELDNTGLKTCQSPAACRNNGTSW